MRSLTYNNRTYMAYTRLFGDPACPLYVDRAVKAASHESLNLHSNHDLVELITGSDSI